MKGRRSAERENNQDHSIFPKFCIVKFKFCRIRFYYVILFISHAFAYKHREESLGNANFELIYSFPIMHHAFYFVRLVILKVTYDQALTERTFDKTRNRYRSRNEEPCETGQSF